jgi:hypothetical protein
MEPELAEGQPVQGATRRPGSDLVSERHEPGKGRPETAEAPRAPQGIPGDPGVTAVVGSRWSRCSGTKHSASQRKVYLPADWERVVVIDVKPDRGASVVDSVARTPIVRKRPPSPSITD